MKLFSPSIFTRLFYGGFYSLFDIYSPIFFCGGFGSIFINEGSYPSTFSKPKRFNKVAATFARPGLSKSAISYSPSYMGSYIANGTGLRE